MDQLINIVGANGALVFLIIIVLPLVVQRNLYAVINKYNRQGIIRNLTGAEVAQLILHEEGIYDVEVVMTRGQLTDNYNPSNKTVNLSPNVYNGRSVSSVSIAAHEVGHAIQHHQKYFGLAVRSAVLPFAMTGGKISGIAIIVGIISQVTGLLYIGAISLAAILIFQLATLPVEFDASNRALVKLQSLSLVQGNEIVGSKKVLRAAAYTYVVATIVTFLNMLRILAFARRND